MRHLLLLLLGVFFCSTSILWIKSSGTSPVLMAGYRTLIGGLLLLPFFLRALKKHPGAFTRGHLARCVGPGLLLAAHFITWVIGGRTTVAGNATLIVNMVPAVMPFLLYVLLRERINGSEVAGTMLAMLGVLVLGVGDYRFAPDHLAGDAICFGSMVLYGVYLTLGRRNRDFASLYLYIVPVYLVAGVAGVLAGLPQIVAGGGWLSPLQPGPGGLWLEAGMVLGLALVPTVLGHSLMNLSMRNLRGQVVALLNLGQFVFATVMAFGILGEVPAGHFYPAACLVVCGAIVVTRLAAREARAQREAPVEAVAAGEDPR